MSNMKNGFSTLNRWLGRKQKGDKDTPNGKLSKSHNNLSLSVSSTNINETSQLEYNRITPLPVVTSNAPFEQTFRITVLLPKDQLYVARLGARVPLSKLLELVCENKTLDADKYEFRNPVDPSQVYNCELTIGAVGLSEIRLCHKSESYDSFNTDEVMKLHRTPVIRDSLSSSEFSSRYSKHTTKTTSPYSSSNSLNSMDSTGMNYTRKPVSPPATLTSATSAAKIAPPPRKKRAAPRPPSQTVILEKSALDNISHGNGHDDESTHKDRNANQQANDNDSLPSKDYFVSTPNLSNSHSNASELSDKRQSSPPVNGNIDEDAQVQEKNARNLCGGSVQSLQSPSAESTLELPEPSPRKRLVQMKKKSAPAPPPRGSSYYSEDNVSMRSATPSTPDATYTAENSESEEEPVTVKSVSESLKETQPLSPKPRARVNTAEQTQPLQSSTPVLEPPAAVEQPAPVTTSNVPKPLPRITTTTNTTTTLLNASTIEPDANHSNVSKVMLNRTPTPEPRSLSAEPPETDLSELHTGSTHDDDDAVSKQADSGIGEPVPSPIPDSLPSEGSAHECKSTFESSSDDDDIVKVYNFKLGKTVKPLEEPTTLEQLTALADAQTDSGEVTPATITTEPTPNYSDTASWNFAIPISPPPNFADVKFMENEEQEKPPDMPITPKINERPLLNFESLTKESKERYKEVQREIERESHIVNKEQPPKPCTLPLAPVQNTDCVDQGLTEEKQLLLDLAPPVKPKKVITSPASPPLSPTTPLNEIVDELSAIINDKRMDTLIKKPDAQPQIESAKPNTLSNFTIATITEQSHPKPAPKVQEQSVEMRQNRVTERAESFHVSNASPSSFSLSSRSSSQISLTKLEQNGLNLNRRRSSSELSIGEAPTLQSPEVIKNILNSRKNSLEQNSDSESKAKEAKSSNENTKPKSQQRPEEKITISSKHPEQITMFDTPDEVPANKPKEVPKMYRYSGPPSINFSTWNERPKVQVAIKNEGDYIFGGNKASKQNSINVTSNTHNVSQKTHVEPLTINVVKESAPEVAPKPLSPLKRMGIPEQEFHVPITVKPLRDVVVENVTVKAVTKIETSSHNGPSKPASGVSTVMLNGAEPTPSKKDYSAVSTTLPRSSTNRFSTPASINVGPALLRSTSITQLEAKKPKAAEEPAPFGQNTLRRTGLKEKILAKEALEQEKAKNMQPKNTNIHTPLNNGHNQGNNSNSNSSSIQINLQQPPTGPKKTLQSAKLEMKLQNTHNTSNSMAPATQHSTTSMVTKLAQTPKSTPMNSSSNSITTVPPPPPPMTVQLRSVGERNSAATKRAVSADPRDQMLAAIRNFKRDSLNRV